jgi:hypothetical protein
MKTETLKPFLFAALLATVSAHSLHAQTYTLPWYKVSGGGGTSANGEFSVNGAIGQHDASGAMSGGSFSLSGGFWGSISVVPTPSAPTLIISAAANQIVISWPASATTWTLQTNSNLGSDAWGDYAGPIVNNTMTNQPRAGNLFFRLAHP